MHREHSDQLYYVKKALFDFILSINTIVSTNMTLSFMLTNLGDVSTYRIKQLIYNSLKVKQSFLLLFQNSISLESIRTKCVNGYICTYLIEGYLRTIMKDKVRMWLKSSLKSNCDTVTRTKLKTISLLHSQKSSLIAKSNPKCAASLIASTISPDIDINSSLPTNQILSIFGNQMYEEEDINDIIENEKSNKNEDIEEQEEDEEINKILNEMEGDLVIK